MDDRTPKLPPALERIFKREDNVLGNIVVWFLCFTVFPTGGFYLGTIASPASNAEGIRHFWDLHVEDMHFGGLFALIGLAIGICFGLWITFGYPNAKEMDAKEDLEQERRVHDLAGHHDSHH